MYKMIQRTGMAAAGLLVMMATACNPEPNESDLYTFTGETIESYIAKDSTLTAFNTILSKVKYDKMMSAYGAYTCFAPSNDGVSYYCDSLYKDKEAVIPYNGMRNPTEGGAYLDTLSFSKLPVEEKIQWLSDSLCLGIARYHISNISYDLATLMTTEEVQTMSGYECSCSSSTGYIVLGGKATIVDSDHETVNGLVHKLDYVIPRYARFIGNILDHNKEIYSIFAQALNMTGLADSLLTTSKGQFTFKQLLRDNYSGNLYPANGVGSTGTIECKVGYTLFAETDEVMRANGINDINDLIEYANNVYGDCKEWYDYVSENDITVSTGDDYTNRFNALNMFVAYHIVNGMMAASQLVFEKGTSGYWNFAPDADPHDYYETMLPHTMLKVWEPVSVGSGRSLFINRYQTFNSLTNELGTQGTNHDIIRDGIQIDRSNTIQATNAYIHPIKGMLVYDEMVPKGVLNERMRVNCTSLFPELINNRYRYWSQSDGNIPSGWDGSRMGIPKMMFDNIVYYDKDPNVCLAYCLRGAWRCWQADQMQFWGKYDFAFKLPSVPSGNYEIRVVYAPMTYGSFMQYYIGTSSSVQDMRPLGLPFDATVQVEDPRIGLTDAWNEDDKGIASDIAMHNRGYMRGPHSYTGHGENGYTESGSARFEYGTGSYTIRYVLGRVELNQGEENWLRIKTLNPEQLTNPVGLDFVELVPTSVLDNQQYMEDWY